MSWIKSHKEILNHPKTLDLMQVMKWDVDTCIAKLHRLWWWCVDYAEDGDLRKHNDDRLARAVGLNSENEAKLFVDGLVQAGWLEREPYFRVHDWWDHIGDFLKRRYHRTPDKWGRIEKMYSDASCISNGLIHDSSRIHKEEKREEEKKEKGKRGGTSVPFQPPSIEEVRDYIRSNRYEVSADKWFAHYESNGWMVGKTKMKKWKACVQSWHFSDTKTEKSIPQTSTSDRIELNKKILELQGLSV